jgi:hypothetical protein
MTVTLSLVDVEIEPSLVDVEFLIFLVVCPGPKHLNPACQIKIPSQSLIVMNSHF